MQCPSYFPAERGEFVGGVWRSFGPLISILHVFFPDFKKKKNVWLKDEENKRRDTSGVRHRWTKREKDEDGLACFPTLLTFFSSVGTNVCPNLDFFFFLLFFFCVESYSFLTLNTPKASVLLCNASPISRLEWPKTQRISLLFFYWHLGPRCTQTDTKNNALESQLEGRMLCGNYEKSFVNCCLLTVSDRVRWIGRYTKTKSKGKTEIFGKKRKEKIKKVIDF